MRRFFSLFTAKMAINFITTNKPKKIRLYSSSRNLDLKNYLKTNPTKALLLFHELLRKKVSHIDSYSLLYVIKACTLKSLVVEGKQLHSFVVKLGFEPVIFLQTSLLDMYSASGNLEDARKMFDEMPSRNIVCWTALVTACVRNGEPNRALEVFERMVMANVEPDRVVLTSVLSACADVGALEMGEVVHGYAHRKLGVDLDTDLKLTNALLNMYVKCGDAKTANQLFDRVRRKDVSTLTSMIVGLALHGEGEEALRIFAAMEGDGQVIPNDVTFIGVLMACSHTGKVEEGKRHFTRMIQEHRMAPRMSHYGCMVDLFCRSGMLREAYNFILSMPVSPSAVIWRMLLGSCAIHGDAELAEAAHRRLVQSEQSVAGDDVAMSNIFAAKGLWDEKVKLRGEMKQIRRVPGWSSIHIN